MGRGNQTNGVLNISKYNNIGASSQFTYPDIFYVFNLPVNTGSVQLGPGRDPVELLGWGVSVLISSCTQGGQVTLHSERAHNVP